MKTIFALNLRLQTKKWQLYKMVLIQELKDDELEQILQFFKTIFQRCPLTCL